MNFLEIMGICFLTELVLVLTILVWSSLSNFLGTKAREKREKMIDKMTSQIIKNPRELSDHDDAIITSMMQKQHESSDKEIIEELAADKDLEKEKRKKEFFDVLNDVKDQFEKNE